MSEEKSPIICTTCKHELPDTLKAEDAPKYFCQGPLLPRSDDAHDFASEVQRMLWYIRAIAETLRYGENKEVQPETYDIIFELVGELSEEALRRLNLSLEAMREKEEREEATKKTSSMRKDGRA